MKLIEKILRKLFPKTLHKIVNDEIRNRDIIYHYGSFENYNKIMQESQEYEREQYDEDYIRYEEEEEESERQRSYWEECNKI